MTPVEFQFNYPDGKPIAGMEFVVKLPKSGFIHAVDGIIMPADLKFVTDAMGYALVELAPSSSVYTVRMTTPDQAEDYDSCRKGVTYKFYVPDSAEPVRAQDLFLAPPPNSEPWDETAIRELTEAKVIAVQSAETAVAASVSAEAAAVRAEAASAGSDEDADRAERARDASEAFAIGALAARTETDADRIAAQEAALTATGAAETAAGRKLDEVWAILADPLDPSKGAARVGRGVVTVSCIRDLQTLPLREDVAVVVKDYHKGINNGGGGRFFYDPLMPKSSHNGGTVISPTVPWDGNRTSLAAFLARTGETAPTGLGCFVRRERAQYLITMFGAIGDWDGAAKTGYDNRAAIEASMLAVYHTVVPKGHFGTGGAGSIFGRGLIGKRISGYGELHKMGSRGVFSFNTCIDVQVCGIVMDGQIVRDEAENGNIWDANRPGSEFSFAVSFADCHDCAVIGTTVYDFSWDGLRATGTVAAGGVSATVSTNIDFIGNKLRNVRGSQIWIKAVAGGKINDNHQRNDETFAQKANAIFVVEWCSDIEVSGNRQFYIGDNGIGIGEPDNNAIAGRNKRINVHDNLIDMTRYHAILIAQAEDSQVHSNIVKRGGAKTAMVGYSGTVNCGAITLLGGGVAPANVNVKVTNNILVDPYEIGIYAYDRPGTTSALASTGIEISGNTSKGHGTPPIPEGSTRMLSAGIITQLQHAVSIYNNTTTDGVGDGLRVFGDAIIKGHVSRRITGIGINIPTDTLLNNVRLLRPLTDCVTTDTTGAGISVGNKNHIKLIGCTAIRAGRGIPAPATELTPAALQYSGFALRSVRSVILIGCEGRECGGSGLMTQFCPVVKDTDGVYSENGQVLVTTTFRSGAYLEGQSTEQVKPTFINTIMDGGTTQHFPIRVLYGHADGVALDPEFSNNQVPSSGITTKKLISI